MNALSLFSGIGGMYLAAEAAGIRTIAMCERESFCRTVLKKHWPNIPIFEDVKGLTKEVLADAGVPRIQLIHGGFPCQ
jgi:DNA (cytosine-5)-methyltransferase 1